MAFLFPYDVCCSKTKRHTERRRREQVYRKIREADSGSAGGFDRLAFRGTLRFIVYGHEIIPVESQAPLKDFGKHEEQTSQQ